MENDYEYDPDGTETRVQIINSGLCAARGRNPYCNYVEAGRVVEEYLAKWDAKHVSSALLAEENNDLREEFFELFGQLLEQIKENGWIETVAEQRFKRVRHFMEIATLQRKKYVWLCEHFHGIHFVSGKLYYGGGKDHQLYDTIGELVTAESSK